jgi:hypothetical protein
MLLSLRLFHISCCSLLLAFLLSLSLPPWARTTSASVSQLLHSSSESEGSPAPIPLCESSDDSDDFQGLAAEVWTYIRAVERSGLEGSDESEYSSDEEDSDGGGEDEDDDDDDEGGGNGDGDGSGRGGSSGSKDGDGGDSRGGSGGGGSSRGSNRGGSGGGNNRASG